MFYLKNNFTFVLLLIINHKIMKNLMLLIAMLSVCFFAFCQTNSDVYYQSGYYKPSTGTYVDPYVKTKSNNTNWDNFSTSGNTNYYTGQSGSKAKDYSIESYNYGSGQNIQTGSKGGQYYINENGNKTYVPKRW